MPARQERDRNRNSKRSTQFMIGSTPRLLKPEDVSKLLAESARQDAKMRENLSPADLSPKSPNNSH